MLVLVENCEVCCMHVSRLWSVEGIGGGFLHSRTKSWGDIPGHTLADETEAVYMGDTKF